MGNENYYMVFADGGDLAARYVQTIHGNNVPPGAVQVDAALFERSIAETDGIWRLDADGSISKHPVLVSLDNRKQGRLKGLGEAMETVLLAGFATSLGIKMDVTLEALQKLKTAYDFARLVGWLFSACNCQISWRKPPKKYRPTLLV